VVCVLVKEDLNNVRTIWLLVKADLNVERKYCCCDVPVINWEHKRLILDKLAFNNTLVLKALLMAARSS
jgi:hypothetical protein